MRQEDPLRLDFNVSPRRPVIGMFNESPRSEQAQFDVHYALELGIVARGRMARIQGETESILEPGDVWICGMWEPHGWRTISKTSSQAVFLIAPSFLAQTAAVESPGEAWLAPFTADHSSRPRIESAQRKRLLGLAHRLQTALDEKPERRQAWCRLLVLETLLEITSSWDNTANTPQGDSAVYTRIEPAIQMVLSKQKPISVETAADACAMSRNRFSRVFNEVMGVRFPQFSLRHRLAGAARQLLETDDPIKAVARDWGFSDDSHLHRHFTHHYALSPNHYRNRGREGENVRGF